MGMVEFVQIKDQTPRETNPEWPELLQRLVRDLKAFKAGLQFYNPDAFAHVAWTEMLIVHEIMEDQAAAKAARELEDIVADPRPSGETFPS